MSNGVIMGVCKKVEHFGMMSKYDCGQNSRKRGLNLRVFVIQGLKGKTLRRSRGHGVTSRDDGSLEKRVRDED